jgi:hypothetical protein
VGLVTVPAGQRCRVAVRHPGQGYGGLGDAGPVGRVDGERGPGTGELSERIDYLFLLSQRAAVVVTYSAVDLAQHQQLILVWL